MRVRIDDERSLNSISSVALAAYLKQRGWSVAGEIPDRSTVFTTAERGQQWGIHVPVRDTFPDHAESIARALKLLAEAEERTELEMFHALAGTGSDTISISALHAGRQTELSFHDAGHLMRDSYTLLSSAARATERVRPAFRGPMPADVTHFLRSISPAPIGFDAFELTLFSPVPPAYGQTRMLNGSDDKGSLPEPFPRRVVTGLTGSLHAIEHAIAEVKTKDDLAPFDTAVGQGVSANLCGAVLGLVELSREFGDGIAIDVRWAPIRPRNGEHLVSSPFSSHDAEILRAAGDRLRARASYADEHIIAEVVKLEREPEEFDGQAQLLADIDGQARRLNAVFAEADFDAVITAFRQRLQIELDGDIHPVGRIYELRDPRNLRLPDRSSA